MERVQPLLVPFPAILKGISSMIQAASTICIHPQRGVSRKIYPIGYGMDGVLSSIDQLMTQPQMLLVDTRFSPKSWCGEWREKALREKYGKRYRWAGAYLGNVNFERGPIALADPERDRHCRTLQIPR